MNKLKLTNHLRAKSVELNGADAVIKTQKRLIAELGVALQDAISTYVGTSPKIVTAERIEAWMAVLERTKTK